MATFSLKVVNKINKERLKDEIINGTESSPEMRKEMARVFQRANRRIQNIRAKGYFSPALLALGEVNEGYTVFTTKQSDWNDLKREYARAVAFLNAPTSTATGSHEYENAIKSKFGLTDETFEAMKRHLASKITSVDAIDFVEKQFWGDSKGVAREIIKAAKSASSQLESDSVQAVNAVEREINRTAEEGAKVIGELEDSIDALERTVQSKLKGLNI